MSWNSLGLASTKVPRYLWLHLGAIAIVFAGGALLSVYTYRQSDSNQKNEIFKQVNTVAASLNENRILNLTGTLNDLTNPDYVYLKERFERIRSFNELIRFVYLVGYRDGVPFLFVGSEPPNSQDYSPPGTIFRQAQPSFTAPFTTKMSAILNNNKDRGGIWLTALAPVFDPVSGAVIAEVAMDMDASNRTTSLILDASAPILFTLFILALLFSSMVMRKNELYILKLRQEFTLLMVHEIRSPLDNVIKMIDLQKQGILVPGTKQYDEMTNMLLKNTRGLLSLINDLLDVAKLEAGKFAINRQATDLRGFIGDQVNFYERAAVDAKLTLTSVIDERIPATVSIDSMRIGQVLNNLLSNAIKFAREGGTVIVQALRHTEGQSLDVEAREARVTWFVKDTRELRNRPDSIVIAVTDTGVGLAAKDVPLLFQKFTQFMSTAARGKGTGTGLGLSIAKGITEAHNGTIGVATKEGSGSTFYIFLPLSVPNGDKQPA